MKNLIKSQAKPTVFVGDTHGDLEVSKKVINTYPNHQIVFLGDYVDRGEESKELIDYLLEIRKKYPDRIHLLQGNHEAYKYQKVSPSNFWDFLNKKEKEHYENKLVSLPLAFSMGNILALHGALPEINKLSDIENIKPRDGNWFRIVWGDFSEGGNEETFLGRPQLNKKDFDRIMENLSKKVLIRSHQPHAKERLFNNKCLTILTSKYYGERKIVISNGKEETIDELKIKKV